MQQFHGQKLMDGGGVVLRPADMAFHDGLYAPFLEIRTRQRPGIKQHLPNVVSQCVPIPHAEVKQLVPAEEYSVEMKTAQNMIDLRRPLGHSVVAGIFGLKSKFV